MMAKLLSIYETKSRLSEVLRLVKSGTEVIVTERGDPIAKIIPFQTGPESFEERRERLILQGGILPGSLTETNPSRKKKPGALNRFFKDRK